MKLVRSALFVLALPLVLAACGKKKGDAPASATSTTSATTAAPEGNLAAARDDGPVFSCKTPDLGLCSEWRGLARSELAEAKSSCSDPGETFSNKPCATTGVIATCENAEEKVKLYITRSAAVGSLKDAKELCDDGKFTALAK